MCIYVCTIFPALQMIFLEDENMNIIVFVIELALECTYIIKNPISRFFFPISLSHKRISLFLYMSPWLYLQDDCASLHDSRCLTYKYSGRKDWFVTVRVKFFLVSFWDNDNALLVTELPLSLFIYLFIFLHFFFSPFVSRFVFFFHVWCI